MFSSSVGDGTAGLSLSLRCPRSLLGWAAPALLGFPHPASSPASGQSPADFGTRSVFLSTRSHFHPARSLLGAVMEQALRGFAASLSLVSWSGKQMLPGPGT